MKKITVLCMFSLAIAFNINAQDTCATALALTPGTQQCDDTANVGDTFDDNACLESYDGGNDFLFTYTAVNTGNVLTLDLTSSGTWTGIAVSEGCPEAGGGTCFGASTSSSGNEFLVSDPLTAGMVYYIHISTWPSPQTADFCLDSTVGDPPAPPANDTCAGVIDLGGETSPLTATTVNANNDFGQDCLTDAGAPDVVYSILVPDTYTLTIEQTSNSYDSKHRLAYGAACPGDMLIVCTDDPDTNQETWTNTTGSAQTVYWIQSAFSTGSGDFTLAWTVEAPPACPEPVAITIVTPSETTANISWSSGAGGTETAWEYVVQAAGTGEPSGAGTPVATPSDSVTGLTADTAYEVYVRADCGSGTFSVWSGPENFTTPIPPVAVPYLNDFTTFPGTGWTEAGSGNPTTGPMTLGSGDWTSDDYGNDIASPNGTSARINLWQAVDQEWLISPIFDLTGAGPYYLNMDVALTPFTGSAATNFGSDDEVQVLITGDGGATWVNLLTYNLANQPGTSREAAPEVDLSSYAGGNVQIAIWATDGTVDDTEDNNFYVDNFQVTSSSLGLEDVAFNGFKYFPNPVEGTLSLRAQENIQAIFVYNMLGQEVLRTAPNGLQDELDMSGLTTGAYFLKVRINDGEENFRIIKE